MWPWEHLGVGYLLYSLGCRALGRDPPSDAEATVLACSVLLPDLIDKPLSWGLGWVTGGYTVGHSLVLAVPAGLGALTVAHRRGTPRLGVAAVVGYWSHLLGDVVSPLRSGGQLGFRRVGWPFVERIPYTSDRGLERGVEYLRAFLSEIPSTDPLSFVLLYLLAPGVVVAVWVADGAPGVAVPGRLLAVLQKRRA